MNAIEIENLTFSYGGRPVLENISLTIPEGKLTVLLGKNGSGKSTLLRLMAGLLAPDSGAVSVLGKNLLSLSMRERAALVGFLAQSHTSVFPFTVEDVVLTGRAGHVAFTPKKEDRDKATAAIETVGIAHLSGRAFTELSGGEQQMVMIARVLAQDPRIILFDEPTSSLDIFHQARFFEMVREFIGAGITAITVLHDPNMAFLHGDNCIFLIEGRIFPIPPGTEPWSPDLLERVYGTSVTVIPYGNKAIILPTNLPGV